MLRAASKPLVQTSGEAASQGDTKQTLQAAASLFIVAIGFGLVGFICGAIASSLLLLGLATVHVPSSVATDILAGLVTGLVAGVLAGYLVERVGERFQLTSSEARAGMWRSVVVAGAVGAVVGLLSGGLAGYPAGGLILSTFGVAALAAAVGCGVAAGVREARSAEE
jgi:hypothetical protein